jgi:hypothetical protein
LVEPVDIAQWNDFGVRIDRRVYTRTYSELCKQPNPGDLPEIKVAMKAIGADIAARVAAEGGTVGKDLRWGVKPGEWVYEAGGRRGVVTVAIFNLNRPTPTDMPANLAVVVQLAEF